MPNTSFFFLWALFAGVAVVILAFAGKAAKKGLTGALIDERNRYSLNRFQLLMWTVLILSAFTAFFFTQGLKIPAISAELLGLIGISAASATTAGAVKSSKISRPKAPGSGGTKPRLSCKRDGSRTHPRCRWPR